MIDLRDLGELKATIRGVTNGDRAVRGVDHRHDVGHGFELHLWPVVLRVEAVDAYADRVRVAEAALTRVGERVSVSSMRNELQNASGPHNDVVRNEGAFFAKLGEGIDVVKLLRVKHQELEVIVYATRLPGATGKIGGKWVIRAGHCGSSSGWMGKDFAALRGETFCRCPDCATKRAQRRA
jgi:hypothetical protein